MKSFLQGIALLASILLLASCDSGVGSGVANIQITQPTPQAGITGRAVKGVISGATVTVTDKDGNPVDLTATVTTNADGTFAINFTSAEISAATGLDQKAPFEVTVAAPAGATLSCDYQNTDGSGNDCPDGTGGYVAANTQYTLTNAFSMSCILPSFPAQTNTSASYKACNVSPASTLAAQLAKAAGSPLTAAAVNKASDQVLGLIQTLTGIDMSGQSIADLQLIDLTNLSASDAAAGPAAFAMAAFNAAVYGQMNSTTTIADALSALTTNITSASSGNLIASGTFLAKVASSIATSAKYVYNQLVAAGGTGGGMDGASSTAQLLQPIYQALGGSTVSVPPPTAAGTSAVAQGQQFVADLTSLIKNIQADTGAYQGGGFTLPLAKQLNAVRRMTDADTALVAGAFRYAVIKGEQNMTANATTTADLGQITMPSQFAGVTVTGTLVKGTTTTTGDTVKLSTDGTATMTDAGTNTMIAMTVVPVAFRVDLQSFSLPQVTIDFTNTTNSDLMAEFIGNVYATFAPESPDLTMTAAQLVGVWCLGSCGAGNAYQITLVAGNLAHVTSPEVRAHEATGDYQLVLETDSSQTAYSASQPLMLGFAGAIDATTQKFVIFAGEDSTGVSMYFQGSVTRNGNLDTVTLRGPHNQVTLTMTLDRSKTKANGALTAPAVMTASDGTQAGTINAAGLVTYADGSVQSLPAAVF